ncbi:sensor histidine kinase [Aquihabitans sp. G128]|uniref:sensor histidine kinase n=1 Tax=Aquihabitans sp. G128 TaxID=2849779 RepID=UPI001C21B397|nr:sensor histidine kinase [Aquihabitans sp. G128]QXC62318.1 sensor histidine kinase [Aquihabitans sp. G128]
MTDQGCATGDASPHAWERVAWAWHLFIPVLLCLSLVAALGDPDLSGGGKVFVVGISVLMVNWYVALRPDLARNRGAQRRSITWGLGSVLLWLPLVLVHPAFFLVLTALFSTIFANVELRPASWLAGLLGIEIAVANLRYGDPTPGEAVFTLVWAMAIVLAAITFARWIHGIIDQSRDRSDLIAQLESTQAELAAAEREAGVAAERSRLTGEIHDTLAQSFTSIVMLLQAVEAGLAPDATARRQVELAIDTARSGLGDARRLIADLAPEALDARTLPDAIERVADRFSAETGVASTVAVTGEQRKLPPTVEVALLRAAQESLANVRKHASATAVTIALRYDGEVTLQVDDDGTGFDPADPVAGFGLRGMRDRLATVDGRVQVDSEPGHGTRVLVAVP